jgi:hypothetical protein
MTAKPRESIANVIFTFINGIYNASNNGIDEENWILSDYE